MNKQAARQGANQTFWFMWVFIVVIIVFPVGKAVRWTQRKLLLPCSMLFLQAQVTGWGFCVQTGKRLESPVLAGVSYLRFSAKTLGARSDLLRGLFPPHCSTREPRRKKFLAWPALSGSGRRQLPTLLRETSMASLQSFIKVDLQKELVSHVAAQSPLACHWEKRQLKPFGWESSPRKWAPRSHRFLGGY